MSPYERSVRENLPPPRYRVSAFTRWANDERPWSWGCWPTGHPKLGASGRSRGDVITRAWQSLDAVTGHIVGAERAAIVAWLRKHGNDADYLRRATDEGPDLNLLADALERGDHRAKPR